MFYWCSTDVLLRFYWGYPPVFLRSVVFYYNFSFFYPSRITSRHFTLDLQESQETRCPMNVNTGSWRHRVVMDPSAALCMAKRSREWPMLILTFWDPILWRRENVSSVMSVDRNRLHGTVVVPGVILTYVRLAFQILSRECRKWPPGMGRSQTSPQKHHSP